jgi:transposase
MSEATGPEQLPEDINELQQMVRTLQNENLKQKLAYEQLQEKYQIILNRFFAKSTEKLTAVEQKQAELFNEAECLSETPEEEVEERPVKAHTRVKKKGHGGREPLPEHLPRETTEIDLPDEQKVCSCGAALQRIGEEVSEKLEIRPPQFVVKRTVRYTYACSHSDDQSVDVHTMKTAPAAPQLIEKGIATESLVAYIATAKYCDGLPLYRQQKMFERLKIHIPRETMGRWIMKASKKLEPLIELFDDEIRAGPVINMDETRVQVHREQNRENSSNSYMWVAVGGDPKKRIVRYLYAPSRGKQVPEVYLHNFSGYLQTDGYEGYRQIGSSGEITHVACLAHIRRKFVEATKVKKKTGAAHEAVSKIAKIYRTEKELREKNLSANEFITARRDAITPLLEDFAAWLGKKSNVAPSSQLGKAVAYAKGQWDKLSHFLDHEALTPDNNVSERAIRPFVIGRKNWQFCDSPRGAYASANFYSLIETAKLNGLDPYTYLRYVLSGCITAETEEDWKKLLPQNFPG